MNSEIQLCPKCPGERFKREVIQRLKNRQYISTAEPISPIKICIELRLIMKENGTKCPHYSESENLLNFL